MTSWTRSVRRVAAGITLMLSFTAGTGCGNGNKSEAPAQFSANPAESPKDSGKGAKPAAKKDRGPADSAGDS